MTSLVELLQSFRTSAWRLEARDEYDISDEREQFEEFQDTGHATPSEEDREFQEFIRSVRRSRRWIGRVRLVGRPVTPYTKFEFDYYPALVEAGEDVRVLDRDQVSGEDGPWGVDFWVFDGRTVAVMDYDARGAFLGVRVLAEPETEPYLALQRRAMELSRPLADYVLPVQERRPREVA